jgi:hypothetical protein
LDIYKVLVLTSSSGTTYTEISPRDEQTGTNIGGLINEDGTTGVPNIYGKTANGIFLDPKPNYNAANGLKVFINREASYFTTSDTTKKPGVPGLFHSWFYLKPALEYARRNNLSNERKIKERVLELEASIKEYFAYRARDERKRITVNNDSNR